MKKQKTWQNVRTPIWKNDTIITPDFVHTLIEWSLDENKEIILVEYQDFFTELKASFAKLNDANE